MRKLFLDDSLKVLMVLTNLEGGKDSEMKGIEPTLGVDIPSEDAETLEQLEHQKSRNKPGMLMKTKSRVKKSRS